MKNILLLVLLIACKGALGQYPFYQTLPNKNPVVIKETEVPIYLIKSGFKDTCEANHNIVSKYAGAIILVGYKIYFRSADLAKWVYIQSIEGLMPECCKKSIFTIGHIHREPPCN